MAPTPERLTLDTMLILDLWGERPRREAVERLLELDERGHVDLAVTATIRQDIPHPPLARRIDELPKLGIHETGTVARLGEWILGRDRLGSDAFVDMQRRLHSERQPRDPKLPGHKDWDHIHAHMLEGRDVFLTWDRAVLRLSEVLWTEQGVRVMRPDEYLEQHDKRP